jgi:quercetin dioxygenase-like cupin family protein
MPSSFADGRGLIEDLLVTPLDSVTRIVSWAGSIRGNHVHAQTTQWTYVVRGRLRIVTRDEEGLVQDRAYGPGDMACELPGVAHAWEALEDCTCLVFTRGPRSGEGYEGDTVRLAAADRLI